MSVLVPIQGAMLATTETASAWKAVLGDTPRAYITSPAGAWRSEAMVVDMYTSSPAERKRKYGVPLGLGVAKPKSLGGRGSVHQDGTCLDVNSFTASVMRKHGFVNTIPTEPWHWAYRGGGSSGGSIPTPTPEPIPVPEGHDDMETVLCIISDGDNRYGKGANTYFHCLWYPPTGKVTDISVALGNQLATRFGTVGSDGEPSGSGANMTYADWEAIHGGKFTP